MGWCPIGTLGCSTAAVAAAAGSGGAPGSVTVVHSLWPLDREAHCCAHDLENRPAGRRASLCADVFRTQGNAQCQRPQVPRRQTLEFLAVPCRRKGGLCCSKSVRFDMCHEDAVASPLDTIAPHKLSVNALIRGCIVYVCARWPVACRVTVGRRCVNLPQSNSEPASTE